MKRAEATCSGIRVLLINPPVRLSATALFPPIGLISIAAVLEQHGATVEILDLNLRRLKFDEVCSDLQRRSFDVIGMGGMTTVYYYLKMLSLYLKRVFPGIPVIGGGSACSASPRVVMENTGFDAVCVGEGEPVVVELVRRLVANQDVSGLPGVWFKTKDGRIVENPKRARMLDLDHLPLPAYHLVDMAAYMRNCSIHKYPVTPEIQRRVVEAGIDEERARRPVMLFSKRGCPFCCDFCYRNFGREVVTWSVDYTLRHMSLLEQQYNTAHFVFGDETFNVDKAWVHEFCQRIVDEGRRYIIGTSNGFRANLIDQPLLEAMKRAGFCSIGIGIESFHDPTLMAMGKRQTAEQIYTAIQLVREAGFRINSAQLLFGYETDGSDSMDVNVKMLKKLGIYHAGFSAPCPYPGTKLYDVAVQRGFITDEEGWLLELADKDISDRVINLSGMSDDMLARLMEEGIDRVRSNGFASRHPIIGPAVAALQLRLKRKFGCDLLQTLRSGRRVFRSITSLSGKAEPQQLETCSHEHIREEAFNVLRALES